MDRIFWGFSTKGNFIVKSAYQNISSRASRHIGPRWELIWSWKEPQSVKTFLWLAIQNKLKTKAELAIRHILAKNQCERCKVYVEDSLHALRDCEAAKHIWLDIVPFSLRESFLFRLRGLDFF